MIYILIVILIIEWMRFMLEIVESVQIRKLNKKMQSRYSVK